MRKRAVKYSVLLGLVLGAASLVGMAFSPSIKQAKAYSPVTKGALPATLDLSDCTSSAIKNYYSDLSGKASSQLQGTNLLKNLKPILKNNQSYFSYDDGSGKNNVIWNLYEIVDRDWARSPASDIVNSGSDTYISGASYNDSEKTLTGYSYGKTDPYIHALYVDRSIESGITAWGNHSPRTKIWCMEREHIWPKSHGFDEVLETTGGARGDPMHLYAAEGYSNGVHSNNYYGYVDKTKSYSNCGDYELTTTVPEYATTSYAKYNLSGTSKSLGSGTVFEPQDCDKGDIARACFYMAARYNNFAGDASGFDANEPNLLLSDVISMTAGTSNASTAYNLGLLHDLLEWHHADPVDEFEIHRNNLLFNNYTHNRNPFIDYPEWADYIWGKPTDNMTYSDPTGYVDLENDVVNGYRDPYGEDEDEPKVANVTISYTDIPSGYASSGTSGSIAKTVDATNDLSISYSGINTQSEGGSAYTYSMFVKNKGYIYSSSCPDGFYPSNVEVTFSSSTGESGKAGVTFGSSALPTRNSSVNGAVVKNGTCSASNGNTDNRYWNFSTTDANVQVRSIAVTYTSFVEATEIYASCSRVFSPGDTISKSDLTVWNDLDEYVSTFDFDGDGYQFVYADAPSGGAANTKSFSVSHNGLNTTVTVSVKRDLYQDNADIITSEALGVSGTKYITWEEASFSTGSLYSGVSAANYGSVQLRTSSDSGIVSTTSIGYVRKITVAWNSNTGAERSIDIYGKNEAYDGVADLFSEEIGEKGDNLGSIAKASSTELVIESNYLYIGIRSHSGALYLDSITIEYAWSADNFANYIMYEDTANQCVSKYGEAETRFNAMPAEERNQFVTSSDYAISAARDRLEAWAAYHGKRFVESGGEYNLSSSRSAFAFKDEQSILVVIGAVVLTVGVAVTVIIVRKKKSENE